MALFLVVYLTSSALLNLHMYRWFRPAFSWGLPGTIVFALVAVATSFLPMLAHRFEGRDQELLAAAVELPAFLWFFLMLLVVCSGVLTEVYNVIVRTLALGRPDAIRFLVTPRTFLASVGILGVLMAAWGLVEVRQLKVGTVTIHTDRLARGAESVRILHVSDIHFSPMTGRAALVRLDRAVREANADVIFFTGDLFDSRAERMHGFARSLAKIQPPFGKFAVLGNHEYYLGLENSLRLLGEAGFTLLRQESTTIDVRGTVLHIAGVDDTAGRTTRQECLFDAAQAVPTGQEDGFRIFLKHQPELDDAVAGRIDLQLSGHTHGGQIFPFHVFVRMYYPFLSGLHELAAGHWIHVSRGVGTWGPPWRVLAPPEVTVIVLEPVL